MPPKSGGCASSFITKILMLPRIIGFAGPAKVGKDSVAAHFVRLGYQRLAFADELKRRAAIALSTDVETINARKDELRPALVAIGAGARAIDPLVWVRAVEKQICKPGLFVVCDVRYANEKLMLERHGGAVVYVERDGVDFANDEERRTLPEVRERADMILTNDDPAAAAARVISFLRRAA